MMNNNEKIYVVCPGKVVTGGAECLHQLVDTLNNSGKDAYMYYFEDLERKEVHSEYKKYNVKIASHIEDTSSNILVLFEAVFEYSFNYKHIKKILWWLSVDNFFECNAKQLSLSDYFKWDFRKFLYILFYRFGHLILRRNNYFTNTYSINDLLSLDALHLYQSTYVQHFMISKGFYKMLPLKDYINEDYLDIYNSPNLIKENIIAYNPKKGFIKTKYIIAKLGGYFKFVPIQNMTRMEVVDLLKRSLIYIDFGNHPGRDKIPREALLCQCFIISNYEGSAGFYEDVTLIEKYKVKDFKDTDYLKKLFTEIQNNPQIHREDFKKYGIIVKNQKEEFHKEVRTIFDC